MYLKNCNRKKTKEKKKTNTRQNKNQEVEEEDGKKTRKKKEREEIQPARADVINGSQFGSLPCTCFKRYAI